MNSNVDNDPFVAGDEVVLALGTYQGTSGIFLRLTADRNWAGIEERGGKVRNHPVAWLAHATRPAPQDRPTTRPEQNDGAE